MAIERRCRRRWAAAFSGLTLVLLALPATGAPLRFLARETLPDGAVLELQTDELVTMTAIPFRLFVTDAAGQPLTGARVSCNLTMPAMAMPENRPKVVERDGAYAGEMVLTCTMGDYRVACVAENDQGLQRTMTFDIGRARLK